VTFPLDSVLFKLKLALGFSIGGLISRLILDTSCLALTPEKLNDFGSLIGSETIGIDEILLLSLQLDSKVLKNFVNAFCAHPKLP
jgi:hypothetical protein